MTQNLQSKDFFFPEDDDETIIDADEVEEKPQSRNLAHQEKRVNAQLDKIMKELNRPSNDQQNERLNNFEEPGSSSPEIVKLEKLLHSMQSDTSGDPELRRLDGMLDKILQIQNPVKESSPSLKDKETDKPAINLSTNKPLASPTGFYGLSPAPVSVSIQKAAIRAVVHDNQTLQDGSTVKLRLLDPVYVGQQQIAANTFIYGICNISDERLEIILDKLAYNNTIYPIKMKVYDTDGIEGIHIPGAITRDAAKAGMDRTMQALTMTSLDPSLSAQAANAGIQSLQTLLSKKIKMVRVTVKSGHQVFLQ